MDDAILLREILELGRDQGALSGRLALVEARLSEIVEVTKLIKQDVDKTSITLANMAGRLEHSTVAVTVQSAGSVGTFEGGASGGGMRDVNVGRVGGDFSGGHMSKIPTRWLYIAVIALILVAGGIAGVKAIFDKGTIQVDPDDHKEPPKHQGDLNPK